MNMEQQELEKDINLITYHQKVDQPTSLDPKVEKVPNDQGDNEILGGSWKERCTTYHSTSRSIDLCNHEECLLQMIAHLLHSLKNE